MNPLEVNPDPYGTSDEFDPTPQYERPIRDLPDEEGYEGQQCPVCGYDLTRNGDCTGNGCGADLGS